MKLPLRTAFAPKRRYRAATAITVAAVLSAGLARVANSQEQASAAEPSGTTYTFSTISDPNGKTGTSVAKINDSGEVVGAYYYNNSTESGGFLDQSGKFTTILPVGSTYGAALGLNNSGEIVGFYSVGSNYKADPHIGFIYTGGKYTTVKSPSSTLTWLEFDGINDSGTICGTIGNGSAVNGNEAFTYSGGKFSYIIVPGAKSTSARAIANSGEVAGVYYDSSGNGHGFTYLNGKFTMVNVPNAKSTYVEGMSYKTGVLGGYFVPTSGSPSGFVYSNGAFTSVNYPGGKDTIVTGINDSGDLVGDFVNSSGYPEGFLAKP